MAPTKCDQCDKSITKKNPGIHCSKCGMVVHANIECANLTSKQLSVFKGKNLEWKCDDCGSRSHQRSSLIVPEDDEQEKEIEQISKTKEVNIDIHRMIENISKNIEKAVKSQLGELEKAIEYCSNKVDEYAEEMAAFRTKIRVLEKRNESLENSNKCLSLKIMAMEQKINEDKQKSLVNCLEIAGVPYEENEDLNQITKIIAKKLDKNVGDIKNIERVKGKTDGIITLELHNNSEPASWVKSSKAAKLKLSELLPKSDTNNAQKHVLVRHALTTYNKTLLYKTKQRLSETHMFIWASAEGKILVRKDHNSKIKVVRFEEDIVQLLY